MKEARDQELENIIGNLLIAEYQVERLRARVIENLGAKYTYAAEQKQSTHIFRSNGRWIKVSINVEEMTIESGKAIREGE